MKITLCGSISYYEEMKTLSRQLKVIGFTEVTLPVKYTTSKHKWREDITDHESGERKIALDLIKKHYYKIVASDCILVVNLDRKGVVNYVGGNTFLEMGFAFVSGKPIFMINPIPEMSYTSEINGMKPIVVGKHLNGIKEYYSLHK